MLADSSLYDSYSHSSAIFTAPQESFDNQTSILITSSSCTGGLDSSSNANGTVFAMYAGNPNCSAATGDLTLFNFGLSQACVPFLGGTWGQLEPNGDGNFSAALFCNDTTCEHCVVDVDSTFGCHIPAANMSWNVQPLAGLTSCAAGSSSKLSAGAIVGIVIGSTVRG